MPLPRRPITDVVDLTHESYEDANSNDETTQDATSDVVDGEETSESDANDTEVSTPETAEPTFVGLQTVTPEYGDKLTAECWRFYHSGCSAES